MRILIEHPIFQPYQTAITGGTEQFTHLCKQALEGLGHEVTIFGTADSTLDCIRSTAYSTFWMERAKGGKKNDTKTRVWYNELAEASRWFDKVILNTSAYSPILLTPDLSHWYHKVVYFNHNGSNWFVRGFCGRQMQSTLRYMRSFGAKTFYFAEANRARMEADWLEPRAKARALSGRVDAGFRRIGTRDFLELDLWDGWFNQAVVPADIAPPHEPEGFLVAVGREHPDKRLWKAKELGEKLGREVFILSGVAHAVAMKYMSAADCLLLPSRHEVFGVIAFEAVAMGVPVSYIEEVPPLRLVPELAREWGDVTTNTFEERQVIAKDMSKWSIEAFGKRLEEVL